MHIIILGKSAVQAIFYSFVEYTNINKIVNIFQIFH